MPAFAAPRPACTAAPPTSGVLGRGLVDAEERWSGEGRPEGRPEERAKEERAEGR